MDPITARYPFKTALSFKPFFEYLKKRGNAIQNTMPCAGLSLEAMIQQAPVLNGPIPDLSVLERHRELILKPREEDGPNFGDIFYERDETADVFDDAALAREMRRQQEEYDD